MLKKNLIFIYLILFIVGFNSAYAQQTIFSVPSADITPTKNVFVLHESQFRPWNPDGYWIGTNYTSVGVGHNTEIDLTLFNVSSPLSHNIVLGTGFKSSLPLPSKKLVDHEVKLTIGSMLPVSLQGEGVGNWSYAHMSGRLPKLKTRLSAGVNFGTKQLFGRNTVGFIGGIEQPVTKKLSIIGDWYSGTHSYGFFIPGISYSITNTICLYAGWQIPNNRRCGKSGFVFEIAKFFK